MSGFHTPQYVGMGGGGILQETLKSSMLFNFRTGNVVVDTLITGLVIYMTTYLMGRIGNISFSELKKMIYHWIGLKEKRWKKIIISSKSSQSQLGHGGNLSPLFNAVLHRIKQIDCDNSEIIELSEILIQNKSINDRETLTPRMTEAMLAREIAGNNGDTFDDLEEESEKRTNLVVSQYNYFQLADDVFGRVKIIDETQQDPNVLSSSGQIQNTKQQNIKVYEITITSQILSMNELRTLVQSWVKDYLRFIKPEKELQFFQFQPPSEAEVRRCYSYGIYLPPNNFSEYRFESSKQFENLFFPEKTQLVAQLDHFLNNAAWYKKKGLPYTLGFLFHGEPGCGKTSTIKAIANYSKRHIVSISLTKIETQKELFEIFYNEYINERKIPLNKRLYILEDIDCNALEDIVGERSGSQQEPCSKNEIKEGININLTLPEHYPSLGKKEKKRKTELTLADILETLDGVMEMDGRMLVITTNYPDKLDAALTRPGRIDLSLEFKRCTSDTLCEMYHHFCSSNDSENDMWPDNFEKDALPSNVWTPAEATQIFVKNIRSPINALKRLQNKLVK